MKAFSSKFAALLHRVPVSWRLIIGLLSLAITGSLLLMTPFAARTQPLSWNEATFTAVSALTCTGLSVISVSAQLSDAGQWILLLLIQIGGVGYMTLAILVLRLIGRQIALADRLALQDALGVVNVSGVFQLSRYVLLVVLCIELVGAYLLYHHWNGFVPDQDRVFFALFHAVSSFCNAGFDLFTGHPDLAVGFPIDRWTLLIKGVLIIAGGIGIPVWFDLIAYPQTARFKLHTKLTLRVTLWLLVIGMVGIFAAESRSNGTLAGLSLGDQLGYSLFQSASCRSAGFVGMPRFESLTSAGQLAMIGLMFIGSAPASAGGGITTGTFAVLFLAMLAYARGQSTPVFKGRAIPGNIVRKAAAVLTISIFVVSMATMLLLLTHDFTLSQAAFETVSAFATCGLTLDATSKLNVFGQAVIAFTMIWGRLGALTIVFALTVNQRNSKIRYPEEKVLIG